MHHPLLEVQDITIGYDNRAIVSDFSFHINKGDIVSLLGPSGCGKTTILRAIAGFEPIQKGSIQLAQKCLSSSSIYLPPEQRKLGMVFQDYALFPHLNVLDNVCFGLKKSPSNINLCRHLLAMVKLAELELRYPHELSGGQQQRVALARAMAPKPQLLLLDEPFSNLDVDLRRKLVTEIRDILKSQGTSAMLVTHDQEEAFAFADKVGVMAAGKMLQWDTPYELYHEPATPFVAHFVGHGHFIRGEATGPQAVQTELGVLVGNRAYAWPKGTALDVLLRPDDLVFAPDSPYQGTILRKTFMGTTTEYRLELASRTIVDCVVPSHLDLRVGDRIGIEVDAQNLVAFTCQSTS